MPRFPAASCPDDNFLYLSILMKTREQRYHDRSLVTLVDVV